MKFSIEYLLLSTKENEKCSVFFCHKSELYYWREGTVSVILGDLLFKEVSPGFTTVPCKPLTDLSVNTS